MKRGFAWLLTLLALLGLLSGCGGGGDTTASDTASNSAATELSLIHISEPTRH